MYHHFIVVSVIYVTLLYAFEAFSLELHCLHVNFIYFATRLWFDMMPLIKSPFCVHCPWTGKESCCLMRSKLAEQLISMVEIPFDALKMAFPVSSCGIFVSGP